VAKNCSHLACRLALQCLIKGESDDVYNPFPPVPLAPNQKMIHNLLVYQAEDKNWYVGFSQHWHKYRLQPKTPT
jgi:hypothetical protein